MNSETNRRLSLNRRSISQKLLKDPSHKLSPRHPPGTLGAKTPHHKSLERRGGGTPATSSMGFNIMKNHVVDYLKTQPSHDGKTQLQMASAHMDQLLSARRDSNYLQGVARNLKMDVSKSVPYGSKKASLKQQLEYTSPQF